MRLFYAVLGAVLLGIVAILSYSALVNDKASNKTVSCETLAASQLSQERSLGLLVGNRKLLSVQLQTEGNFSPPGGNRMGDESPEQTLQRELEEELVFSSGIQSQQIYKTICSRANDGGIARTTFYLIDIPDEDITIKKQGDSFKWVTYSFIEQKKADQDLIQALSFMKQDGLVD